MQQYKMQIDDLKKEALQEFEQQTQLLKEKEKKKINLLRICWKIIKIEI